MNGNRKKQKQSERSISILSKLKSFSKDSDDYFQSSRPIKGGIPQKHSNQQQQNERNVINILNKTLVNIKKQQIVKIFIQKLKRSPSKILPNTKSSQFYNLQLKKSSFKSFTQTIAFPQYFFQIFSVFSMLSTLTLTILSTFQGFIQNFHQQSDQYQIKIIKIVCLIISILYFAFKCVAQSFQSGRYIVYIYEAFIQHGKTMAFFFELGSIILQILALCLNNVVVVSQILFFVIVPILFFNVRNMIRLETTFFKTLGSLTGWRIIKLLIINIMWVHIMATFILGMSRLNPQTNWMTRLEIAQQPWYTRYSYSLYWSATIMVTVGFGDILPANSDEVIILSFYIIIGCMLLAYNISSIGSLLSSLKEQSDQTRQRLVTFQLMAKQNEDISEQLKKDIINYIKRSSHAKNLKYEYRKDLLNALPQHLRDDYYKQANKKIFNNVIFFSTLKKQSVYLFAKKLESKYYLKGDHILGTQQNIFILQFGQIGYCYEKRGSRINGCVCDRLKVQKKGDNKLITTTFLNLQKKQNYTLITNTDCLAWTLSMGDFLQAISRSRIDSQYYFNVLHKHSLDCNQWEVVKCPRCSPTDKKKNRIRNSNMDVNHLSFNCPMLTYIPIKQYIAMKYDFVLNFKECVRSKFIRQRRKGDKLSVFTYLEELRQMFQQQRKNKNIVSYFYQQDPQETVKSPLRVKPGDTQLKIIQKNKQLMQIMEQTFKKYDTGYEEELWELQVDKAYNYQFYFPVRNPNRLKSTCMQLDGIFLKKTKRQSLAESNYLF